MLLSVLCCGNSDIYPAVIVDSTLRNAFSHSVLEWKAARNQTAKATKLGIDVGISQSFSRKIKRTNSLSRYFFLPLLYLSVGLSGTWTTSHPTFTPDLGEMVPKSYHPFLNLLRRENHHLSSRPPPRGRIGGISSIPQLQATTL